MSKDKREDIEQEEDLFSLKNFLLLCAVQWKWFLLSVIFFVGMSLLYIARKQPVFEREMEVLVKDQHSGGGIGEITNSFSQLGLVSTNPNVLNELISLTSPSLMYDVVERLDLTMNYTYKKGLRPKTLYGTNNPITVSFPDLDPQQAVSLRLEINPDGTYTAKKFVKYLITGDKEKYDKEIQGKIGSPVGTPFGKLLVKPNDAYIIGSLPDGEDMRIDIFRYGLQSAVETYAEKLKGDLTDQDADVIKLTIKDVSVERANDILNNVLLVYNERWIEDKNKIAVATSKFITERLGVIEKELGNVDTEISDFKSEMMVPDVTEAGRVILEKDMFMSEEMLKASTMLAMTNFLKEYLQNPDNTYSIIPMNTGVENPVLEEQIAQYNQVLLKRNNMAENSSDQNPLVKDMNKDLGGKRNAIIQSINSNIQNLKNSLASLSAAQAATRGELAQAPKQAKILLSAERQQLVMQELYLFLLQKREETEISQTFTADNVRVITPPYGEQEPVAPKKKLVVLIAFIIGVGLPAGALFLAESANTKIRSKKDLEGLNAPFVGEIPFIGKRKRIRKMLRTKKKNQKEIDKPKIIVENGKRDISNEAFRIVRSNLDFMIKKGETPVVTLTSFNPASGKSFIAFNLGASFSIKGKKVLLVDGDLRHGSVSSYVDSPRKGLTNYLTGSTDDWRPLVKEISQYPGLSVLPIGHKPPNPAELLENGKLEELLNEAKHDYEVILLDCPPVNVVVDTQIINQYSDRTLFVIRAGLLEKSALKELQAIIAEDKLKNVTVVLNGTSTAHSSFQTYGNYEAIDK